MVNLKELNQNKKDSNNFFSSFSLQNIIPKENRKAAKRFLLISWRYFTNGLFLCGRVAWGLTTAMMVVLLPLQRALLIEQQEIMFEQEQMKQQQQLENGEVNQENNNSETLELVPSSSPPNTNSYK